MGTLATSQSLNVGPHQDKHAASPHRKKVVVSSILIREVLKALHVDEASAPNHFIIDFKMRCRVLKASDSCATTLIWVKK